MSVSAADFRNSKIDVLRFLASDTDQCEFARRAYYEDYASEFLCWWLDEFIPDSELFVSAFSAAEIKILQRLSSDLEVLNQNLGTSIRTMAQLQGEPDWRKVMAAAGTALEVT
jgi:hypothetical protein